MAYLGSSPGLVSQRLVNTFTATAGQTTFTTTTTYVVNYVDVYVNGVKLNSADYTATDTSTVVLAEACVVGDIVDILLYFPRGLSDGYTKPEADLLFQPIDADLTGIAALAGTSGFLKKTATNIWSLDTNSYLTSNQSISLSGDASGSGTTSIAVTLASSGVTAGTYNNVTVNTKGLVTSASNINYLTSYTETDTLASVTGRGATTSNAIIITNNTTSTSTSTGALIIAGGIGVQGNLYVGGNLSVSGTTTTINSTTLDVTDLNITIAKGAANSSSANGAGITIDGAGATILYTHATTSFDFNKPINVAGVIYSSTGGIKFPDGTTQTSAYDSATPAAPIGYVIQILGSNISPSGMFDGLALI
jgi:hypothetical protein